jgi:cell division protein FtsL
MRFLALWTTAVLASTAALVAHLSLRLETVRLGYEVGKARREQRRLIEHLRLLAIEAATLRNPARVEAVARARFAMEVPDPTRIVPMGRTPGRRASGRTR